MHAMNLSSVDMNLLPVLDALLRERHVGRAAAAIGRSQPAVSHALVRLRALFGDPLLSQSGRRMVLTARAEALREPISRLMREARGLVTTETFNLATSRRRFRLMMPDFIGNLVLPQLIAKISIEAPGIRLEVAEWRGEKTLSRDYLDTIDLILSGWTDRFPGFRRELLLRDHDALAIRVGSRKAAKLKSVDGFLNARHVAVIGPGERQDLVDTWLRTKGHTRRIALTVPTYLLAFGIVAESDLVVVVPKQLIERLGKKLGVRAMPLPLDPGKDEIFLHHPTIAHTEPGSAWLRKAIQSLA